MIEKLITNEKLVEVIFFIIVVTLTIVIAKLVSRLFRRIIDGSAEDMNNDPTNYRFIKHGIVALIYLVGFSIAIFQVPEFRVLAQSILAGAGVLALAVGFAAQHALSNIISGVFLVIFKPFRINDRLKVKDLSGVVEDITLRHTVIRDFENRRIIIPNTVISDEVIINSDHSDEEKCKFIDVGISYESDLQLAKKIIKEEMINHPLFVDKRTQEEKDQGLDAAPVRVIQLADSSVNLRGWAWTKDAASAFILGCDLNESIKMRFDAEGIEIPYPHRVMINKS